jgi:hypothetical protein
MEVEAESIVFALPLLARSEVASKDLVLPDEEGSWPSSGVRERELLETEKKGELAGALRRWES